MKNQIKANSEKKVRIQAKITPFVKNKIKKVIKHEEKEVAGYNMSDFIRESINLRLAINTREFQKNSILSGDIFFQIAVAQEFIPFVKSNLDLGKSEEESLRIILLELLRTDKKFRVFEKKFRRKTENIIIDESMKFIKGPKGDNIPIELKKSILLKLQEIKNDSE